MRGVYLITNTKNGKVLVGAHRKAEERVRYHTTLLLAGDHPNEALQKDWNEFGELAFEASFITEVPEEQSLLDFEEHYIREYNATNPDKGYNQKDYLESQPQVVLSFEKAEEIRKLYGEPIIRPSGRLKSPYGISMAFLAGKYGVTGELISQILRNQVWKRENQTEATPA